MALLAAGCGDDGGAGEPEASVPQGAPRGVPGAAYERRDPPPNIVAVMTDDQDAASVEVMDEVQRLARRGTTFDSFYASFPLCCPSRATLVTGQYAHNHGVLANEPPDGGYEALSDRADTLGVWLQRAGYRTAWVGKYLNHFGADGDIDPPPGWSRWVVPVFGIYEMFDHRLDEDGEVVEYGDSDEDYQTDVLAEKAAEFVDESAPRRRPFFLMLAPVAPHEESDKTAEGATRNPRPAPRHEGRFEERELPRPPSYNEADISDKPEEVQPRELTRKAQADLRVRYLGRLESLLAVDEALGLLVDRVEAAGELENTAFLFFSDNGATLGEHRMASKKGVPYEESARVPLVVAGPGFPAGETRAQPTVNADLAPTILDIAGARPTRAQDGRSLVGVARDADGGAERAILLEGSDWAGVRAGHYVYVEYETGGRELYDLDLDPYQLENAVERSELAPVRGRLAAALAELRDCTGRACEVDVRLPRAGAGAPNA